MKLLQYIGPLIILLLTTELQAGILRDIHNKNKEHLAAILDPLGIFHNNGGSGGGANAQAESSSINQNLNLGPISFSTSLNHASASANANSGGGSATANADASANGGIYGNGYSKAVANVNVHANTNANNEGYNGGYHSENNGVHQSEYNSNQNGRYNGEKNGAYFTSENADGWNRGHTQYNNGGDGNERYSNNGVNSGSSSSSSSIGVDGKTHTITNTKTHGDARADSRAEAKAHGSYGGKVHNNLGFDHGITGSYDMNSGYHSGEMSPSFVDDNQHYRGNPFLTNVGGNRNTNVNAQAGSYRNIGEISSYVNGQGHQINQGEFFLGRGEQPYNEKGRSVGVDSNTVMSINTNVNAASNSHIDGGGYLGNNNGENYGGSHGSGAYGAINTENIRSPCSDAPNIMNEQFDNAASLGDFVIDGAYRGNQKTTSIANGHVGDVGYKQDAFNNKSDDQGNPNISGLATASASVTGAVSGNAHAIANTKVSTGGNVSASATAHANINGDPEFTSKSSALAKASVIADTSKMLIFSN